MADNTALILLMFIIFGWIPISAIGKAIAMIVEAFECRCKDDDNEEA